MSHPFAPPDINTFRFERWQEHWKANQALQREQRTLFTNNELHHEASTEDFDRVRFLQSTIRDLREKILEAIARSPRKELDLESTLQPERPEEEYTQAVIEEIFLDQQERMYEFLNDQEVLRNAMRGDSIFGGIARWICALPSEDIQHLTKALPGHPRFPLYLERFRLIEHFHKCEDDISSYKHSIQPSDVHLVKTLKIELKHLEKAIIRRDEWCCRNLALSTDREPEDDSILADADDEFRAVKQWLQDHRPNLRRAIWGPLVQMLRLVGYDVRLTPITLE